MADLPIQYKIVADSLHRIPFFRGLPPETLLAISAKLQKLHFEHGAVVFAEGSLGDSMYLIESGQVKVSIGAIAGQQERVINYLGPGNFFGEMALILDQRRSATVAVTIDADLWMLRKADLDEILIDHPEVALNLTREISRRLSDTVTEATRRPGYRITAMFGDETWRVAQKVHEITRQRVVLFDATRCNIVSQVPAELQNDRFVILEAMDNLTHEALVETLGILADGYDWLLIALPPEYNEVSAKAVLIAEAVVLYQTPEEPWIAETTNDPIFYCDGTEAEIGRTARKITRRTVGLALSSGGARGIAHIGVLQALEKANIPVDMIAGTSAGSLFGGLYATGKSAAEVAEFAKNLIKLIDFKSGLWDPRFNLPWNGLIKGNATLKYLSKHFNNATFADTKIPFYVVAADVMSGEEIVFEEGLIAEAVRASIGMIGIFSPYQLNGHYLIDGGAVNPVPASVLAEKGADFIIASSVIPSIEEERARGQAIARRSNTPSFLGVLTSMMAIMEREIVKTRMSSVDVLIKPKVEILTSMDYDQAEVFLQLGREATEKEYPLLQKLLAG